MIIVKIISTTNIHIILDGYNDIHIRRKYSYHLFPYKVQHVGICPSGKMITYFTEGLGFESLVVLVSL